jgi:hypothetical protein
MFFSGFGIMSICLRYASWSQHVCLYSTNARIQVVRWNNFYCSERYLAENHQFEIVLYSLTGLGCCFLRKRRLSISTATENTMEK